MATRRPTTTTTTREQVLDDSDDEDDLHFLVSEQRSELMAAEALESDLELAFNLQLQEAVAASLAHQPSSSAPVEPQNDTVRRSVGFAAVQSEELVRLQQELKDRQQSEIEMRKMREDLCRRIYDQNFAREILRIPEEDWKDWGDNFEKPFCGEGSSSSSSGSAAIGNECEFRLYFKGLISDEKVGDTMIKLAGIGVAICDSSDNLIFEVRKPLIVNGMNKIGAEAKALIEGLNAALVLELKRLVFYCDYYPIFQFVNQRWPAKQRKIAVLINQVKSLQRQFTSCNSRLVPRNDIKFAFKLARDAIVSQTNKTAESSRCKSLNETCVICFEDTDASQIFSVDGCLHRYCFSCMKQHVEVKLLHGILPKCPHEDCKSDLDVDSCGKFLTPKIMETMRQRIKEALTPVTEKVYCAYPRCSVLMSKTELLDYSKKHLVDVERSGARRCMKCNNLFCINCKVPWHRNMTCVDYKRLNPYPPAEESKLKCLASKNLWRQCKKCNHMIELTEGCFHMTCRCGHEFCYNCGAEWKEKKATCDCPLWIEDNILYDEDGVFDEEDDDEEEEEEEEDEDYYYDSDSDYFAM